ncbi:unnamed protein product [Clavelina lepadiformis]|uniref:Peptidase A2 domain-containing protein n=1 Tax=Clavelina lepadiformis TaxID=159417 RepID=A0ABP0GLM8_CLALP
MFRDKAICALVDTGACVFLIKTSFWYGLSSVVKVPMSASPEETHFVRAGRSDFVIVGQASCIVTALDARVPVLLANFSDDSVIIPNGTQVTTDFPISVIINVTYKLPGNYVP